jgi:deoxyribodipyrimidine photo-lyase
MPATAPVLVWFKRDLRVHDHAALAEAAEAARAQGTAMAGLFIVEPTWLTSPECDPQHVAFVLAALERLRHTLAQHGLPLWVRVGEAVPVLADLHARWPFGQLWAHEETGPRWTWDRDRAVAAWCRAQGVAFHERPQSGVVRRLRSRFGWAARWQKRMDAPLAEVPAVLPGETQRVFDDVGPGPGGAAATPLPTLDDLGLPPARPFNVWSEPGEAPARAVLEDFLAGRGDGYRLALSSPLTAEAGCSRLSVPLAFGTLSMRAVHQATEARIDALQAIASPDARRLAYHLRGFTGRLRWHCHFMQKLEDEPDIEHHNFARSLDGLREGEFDRARFEAWCEGRTGFPMVDACMRSLRATGWLNFRMRAMLVSFAAYHLWLHWREPGLFLARQFLDFEPGIHWSQMQMQSGTTGINTVRVYSPSKQAADHDPDGVFVRRWVPEYGTPDYPPPIVDERAALKLAKDRLFAARRTEPAREEADSIQAKHGSRRSGLPSTTRRAAEPKARGPSKRRATGEPGHALQRDLFE